MTTTKPETAAVAAWDEYLEATRGQEKARYEEVEPWAWTRLLRKLQQAGVRLDGGKRRGN